MTRRVVYTLFMIFLLFPCFNVSAKEPQTITPLADTYVEASSSESAHGREEYLKVSDSNVGLSIAVLMFDLSGVSHDSNVSFKAKLRLSGLSSTLPYVIGVHWCVNNTWDEDTLTFVNFSYFVRTKPESVVTVGSENVWHEWDVTDIVGIAFHENYEKITLVLEAEEAVQGSAFAMFYSKDPEQSPNECTPQLVFTYYDVASVDGGVSWDMIGKMIFGVLATAGIVFMAYRFLKKPARKRRRFSSVR